MRALFVSNDPSIFDPASAAHERMRAYAKAIGELHIVSPAPRGAVVTEEGPLTLHPIHAWRVFRIGALAREARRIIRAYDIQVVSAQDPFEQGLAALKATRGTGAKLHVQVHTDFLSPWFLRSGNWRSPRVAMPSLNRYRRTLAERVLPMAHGIRVVSERVKGSLLLHFDGSIVEPTVIPVAVDQDIPAPAPFPQHAFTFVILAVGRLEPEKRYEDLLAAFRKIVDAYPRTGLFIAGEGRERTRLEHMVRALKLDTNVVFLGNRPDARGLMRSANLFVQASAYEGYGRTLVEAALSRVLIVTTDVGIVGEVFTGYEDVLAVPVADPTALANAIAAAISDPAVRIEYPSRAEAVVRAHLAAVGDLPKRIAADLERVLSTV